MSFQSSLTCFRFCCDMLRSQMAQIPAERVDEEPGPGLKAPRWVLGHLAEGHLYLTMFLGIDAPFPDDWARAFAPGTPSSAPYGLDGGEELPPVDGLLDYVNRTEQPILEAAAAADATQLDDPHGIAILDDTLIQTKADLISHLLTSHYAFHLGQLSLWRRAAGIDPMF